MQRRSFRGFPKHLQVKDGKHSKCVHAQIIKSGNESGPCSIHKLITIYCRSGLFEDAHKVFDRMPFRGTVSWNALIAGYVNSGQNKKALSLYSQMRGKAIPDQFTFGSLLKSCSGLEQQRVLHSHIVKCALQSDVFVGTALLYAYSANGSLNDALRCFQRISAPNTVSFNAMIAGFLRFGMFDKACEMFWEMPERDSASWNTVISALLKKGDCFRALEFFREMVGLGVRVDYVSVLNAASACSALADLQQAREIHGYAIRNGIARCCDPIMENAVIHMYAVCGCMKDAQKVFERMRNGDSFAWTSMIAGYSFNGQIAEALGLFAELQDKDLASWNALISGFGHTGASALTLFREMQQDGLRGDQSTFASVIKSCASLADVGFGAQIHGVAVKSGFKDDVVVANALVDMYRNCERPDDAWLVFSRLSVKNIIACTSMICGFAQNGHSMEAWRLFIQMQRQAMHVDAFLLATMLNSTSPLGLQFGLQLHTILIKNKCCKRDVTTNNALLDMYAKNGRMEDALRAFNEIGRSDEKTWNTVIWGMAQNGHGIQALGLFQKMLRSGAKPNEVTFLGLLKACNNAGLVQEGRHVFASMSREHGIIPGPQHYSCMVDLFARSGLVEEALRFVAEMPVQADASAWTSLLHSCRIYGNQMQECSG